MIEEEWERTESPTPLLEVEVQRRALLSDLFTSYGKYVEYWRAQNEQQENGQRQHQDVGHYHGHLSLNGLRRSLGRSFVRTEKAKLR